MSAPTSVSRAGVPPASPSAPASVEGHADVAVSRFDGIPETVAERIAAGVRQVLRRRTVSGGARVRLARVNRPDGSALVQINLRVGGTETRAQTVAPDWDDLAPALDRLDDQIVRARRKWRPRPWPDETRQTLVAAADAVISRRKCCVLRSMLSVEAMAAMDAMDYDVHLFNDAETGEDAVVYRAGPWGLRLARRCCLRLPHRLTSPTDAPISVVVNPRPAPALSEAAAVERLCAAQLRFLFFCDPASGRGRLLYPRYDGDLGLISVVCAESAGTAETIGTNGEAA